MTNCNSQSMVFQPCRGRKVEADFDGGYVSSNGGGQTGPWTPGSQSPLHSDQQRGRRSASLREVLLQAGRHGKPHKAAVAAVRRPHFLPQLVAQPASTARGGVGIYADKPRKGGAWRNFHGPCAMRHHTPQAVEDRSRHCAQHKTHKNISVQRLSRPGPVPTRAHQTQTRVEPEDSNSLLVPHVCRT